MATVRGIDVSDAQGSVDWKKVKKAGYSWAGVKATEGQDFTAKTFSKERIAAMRRAGVVPMPYHYLRPRPGRRGRVEAAHFLKVVRAAGWKPGTDLPLCVDVEETELAPAATWTYVSDFCAHVQKETGRGCVTYISPGFAARLGRKAPRAGAVSWVAAWDAPDGRPPTPAGFDRALVRFHQISDRGTVAGVKGGVDVNLFLGDSRALKSFITGKSAVPKPKPVPKPPADDRMSTREAQTKLRKIGWPVKVDGKPGKTTTAAIRDFQRGFAGAGGALTVDGQLGPKTARAIAWSVASGGKCSMHFTFREFASKGNGWIKVDRELVRGLELYRKRVGHPVGVVSGHRDPGHNKRVGGATSSQHLHGNASDLNPELTVAQVKALGCFSGIGFQAATGKVRHVDVRHRGPNTTGGTVRKPTIWRYG